MTATALTRRETSADRLPRLVPGLAAGMAFAMWAMFVGIFASKLWAPPQGIAQSVGIGAQGWDFQIVPSLLGIMGHMMNSIIIGLVFLAIAAALRLRGVALVIAGMMYGVVVYLIMYYPVLRGILSTTSGSFLTSNPEWSWVLGHIMYGMILGLLLAFGPFRAAWTGERS
jgi:uncharacterized membrane protein YagU involved in acid resistance